MRGVVPPEAIGCVEGVCGCGGFGAVPVVGVIEGFFKVWIFFWYGGRVEDGRIF